MKRSESDQEFADRALRGLKPVRISSDLMRRVAELPLSHPRSQLRNEMASKATQSWLERWFMSKLWLPTFAAASVALGVATGLVTEDLAGSAEVATGDSASVDIGANVEADETEQASSTELADDAELGSQAESAGEESLDGLLALAWGDEADAWDTAWSTE
jgi:hypothetical protein